MMDSTSQLEANEIWKGTRVRIVDGSGKGKQLVIKKIQSPQCFTWRKYNLFDWLIDAVVYMLVELECVL